ncbi:MAG: hypothetical protein QY326_02575 [Bdellovibrionota bacterium]|nr:MAG: hypothetical protein QY326_02575 [Bdellovibrionota bacterium]
MGKIKKFTAANIRKIVGGRDPIRAIEEFILLLGHDPDESKKEASAESIRWMITLGERQELEILLEGLKKSSDTTVYLGVNVAAVPLRSAHDVLVAALEIADGLVGVKVSLVGHFLVLSSTLPASGIATDELEYHYHLISAQIDWFRQVLAAELGWPQLPDA